MFHSPLFKNLETLMVASSKGVTNLVTPLSLLILCHMSALASNCDRAAGITSSVGDGSLLSPSMGAKPGFYPSPISSATKVPPRWREPLVGSGSLEQDGLVS